MSNEWVCLMYHDVGSAGSSLRGARDFFSVTEASFARHLALLRDAGLEGCSLEQALPPGVEKRVAISFDDGNAGQATRAFPALVKSGMTATFFVTTSWVGRPGFVTWEQLREMHDAGMGIESHTHTHPFLSELPETRLVDELRRSRDLLSERLGKRPGMIALPGGDAPRGRLRRAFAREGYEVVATSKWGVNTRRAGAPPGWVRRCTVRGALDDRAFLAIVNNDRWLELRKRAREGTLGFVRRSLGPSRYARWRHDFLDAVGTLAN
jgi:peptidoglycan/xylan/chitin deacetylase (PgdA/CDA1 family)